MSIVEELRLLNTQASTAAKEKQAKEERARKRALVKLSKDRLKWAPTYFQQCIKEAKNAAQKSPECKSVSVLLSSFEDSSTRNYYIPVVQLVVAQLNDEGVRAKYTLRENHGHHNCAEVYEYHFDLYVDISW